MNSIKIIDDFYWDDWHPKEWSKYLDMMLAEYGLKYVDSLVEIQDADDCDIFDVTDERKAQLFVLKHARYIQRKLPNMYA